MFGLDGNALLAIIRACKPHILFLVISGSIHPYAKKSLLTEGIPVSLQNLLQRLTLTSNERLASYEFGRKKYSDLAEVFALHMNFLTHFHQSRKNSRANFFL